MFCRNAKGRRCIFILHNSPNSYLRVCFNHGTDRTISVMLSCISSIQRESGRAATPNRWNKFNDQLKLEPTLSGLRHFNALSSRAWLKVVMTPCCLLLSIKHFAELCSCCDHTSASICDFCSPAGSQEARLDVSKCRQTKVHRTDYSPFVWILLLPLLSNIRFSFVWISEFLVAAKSSRWDLHFPLNVKVAWEII